MLNLLSDEILLMILSYFNVEDLATFKCLSTRFANLAEDACLYRSVTFTSCYRLSTDFIVGYLNKYCRYLRSIDLSGCYWLRGSNLVPAICKCKKVTRLNLVGCKITSSAMLKILEKNSHLDELSWSLSLDAFESAHHVQASLRNKFAAINNLSLELHFGVASAEKFLFENSCIYSFLRLLNNSTFKSLTVCLYKQWQCCVYFKYESENGFCFNSQSPSFTQLNVIIERYHCESFRYHVWPLLSLNSSIELPSTNQFQQFDIDRILSTNPRRLLDTISKPSLKVLNLSFIPTLTSQELVLVITDCKNLIKLDLSGLNLILQDEDFQGLKAVICGCKLLRELVLSHTCISSNNLTSICDLLSKAINLEKLTIPACLMADKNIVKTKRNSIDNTFLPPNRISIMEQNKIYKDCKDRNNNNMTDFMLLTKCCSKIKVFSNSSHYYQSKLSTRLSNHMPSSATALPASCSLSTYVISEDILSNIANWEFLESLSLVGILNATHLSCLDIITKSCKNLKRLSLAYIGLPGHSGALLHLPRAIRNCHNLLEFRLEQPYYIATRKLFESLSCATELQRLCLYLDKGRVDNPRVVTFNQLFHKCKHLTVLQVLYDTSTVQSKLLRRELMKIWLPKRPALVVAFGKSLYELQQDTPQFHIDSITLSA